MELNKEKLLEKFAKPKVIKGIYCFQQEIADEICKWLGTYKEFGLWTKKAKENYPLLKEKLEYMKSRGIKSPRYLLACTRLNN